MAFNNIPKESHVQDSIRLSNHNPIDLDLTESIMKSIDNEDNDNIIINESDLLGSNSWSCNSNASAIENLSTNIDSTSLDLERNSPKSQTRCIDYDKELMSISSDTDDASSSVTGNKDQDKEILEVINDIKLKSASSIDLSHKCLFSIPVELLELHKLEYLYLEDNNISSLPDVFFKCFPCLRWLDLRFNHLCKIPSAFLANHKCLRDLLLEGNRLRNLPLELGLVESLHGLNIFGNPLDFPPQQIIDKGSQSILIFLRQTINAKEATEMANLELKLSEEAAECLDDASASSDDWNTQASMMDLAKRRDEAFRATINKHILNESENKSTEEQQSKPHQTPNRGSMGQVCRQKPKKSNLSWKVNKFPSPPSEDKVVQKMKEEKKMAKVREFKEKTDDILQRRKDDELLKHWRDETKALQQQKYRQKMIPGKDYDETAEQAPFAVQHDMMRVMSKEERIEDDIQREKEMKEKRSLSPATRQRIEQEKQIRIRDLEKRIKEHTAGMVERRKQPKGSAQHEMEVAKRELQIVKKLQKDLMRRYQELKAWSSVPYIIKTANSKIKI